MINLFDLERRGIPVDNNYQFVTYSQFKNGHVYKIYPIDDDGKIFEGEDTIISKTIKECKERINDIKNWYGNNTLIYFNDITQIPSQNLIALTMSKDDILCDKEYKDYFSVFKEWKSKLKEDIPDKGTLSFEVVLTENGPVIKEIYYF